MKNLAPEKVHWSKANSMSYCCYKRRDYSNLQFTKKLLYMLSFLGVFFAFNLNAQTSLTETITWNGNIIVDEDGNEIQTANAGTLSSFTSDYSITEVSVSVDWKQYNGYPCQNRTGRWEYNEIRMELRHGGVQWNLIDEGDYSSSNRDYGFLTTSFSDAGTSTVGAVPMNGLFQAAEGSLNTAYAGQNPTTGNWRLRIYDETGSSVSDALCVTSFSVTVTAVFDCEVSCPSQPIDLNVDLDCASPGAVWPDYRGLVQVKGSCDQPGASLTQSPAPGSAIAAAGAVTVTMTAADANGGPGTDNCSFTVNVINTNTGVLSIACPDSFSEDVLDPCTFTLPDYTGMGMATDECGNAIAVIQSPAAGTVYTFPFSPITITLEDAGENVSCTFDVTPVDAMAPSLDACASDPAQVVIGTNGSCDTLLQLTPPTINDNCGDAVIYAMLDDLRIDADISGAYFATIAACGATIDWFAADASNDPAFLCSNFIDVIETTAPTASCEGGIILSLNADGVAVLDKANFSSGSIDGCDQELDIVVMSDPAYPTDADGNIIFDCNTLFAISTEDGAAGTVVKTIATDCSGNSEMCWNNVVVQDKVNPEITCPADLTINCTESTETSNTGEATATDNSDDCFPVRISYTDIENTQDASLDSCGHYSYFIKRQWIARDTSGNADTCVQMITIIDETRPEWTSTCDDFYPGQSGVDCMFMVDCNDPNLQGVLGYELAKSPTAADDCKLDRIDMIRNDTILGCPSFIIKEWLAYDACDNETADTFRQTIMIKDTIAPFITCPNGGNTINLQVLNRCDTSINLEATASDCNAFAGHDNLDVSSWQYSVMEIPSMNVIQTGSGNNFNTNLLDLGSYMVTFMVSDQCENLASCQTSVVVEDGSDPTLDCATFEAQFTDEDAGTPGVQITLGTDVDADQCGLAFEYTVPRPSDNCPSGLPLGIRFVDIAATGATVFNVSRVANASGFFSALNDFNFFYNLGTTNVTFTYTDANGNVSNVCTLDITVVDDDAPKLACSVPGAGAGELCELWESSDVGQPLIDNGQTLSLVMADGGDITDINLEVNGLHTWVGDLELSLKHPDGTEVTLVNRVNLTDNTACCGCSGDNFNLTFDDEASLTANDLENQVCDFNNDPSLFELEGTYQPIDPLSVFDGKPTAGTWTLTVSDNQGADVGTLVAFNLEVCSEVEDLLTDTVAYSNSNLPGDCYFELNFKHPFLRENCNLVSYEIQYFSDPNGTPDSTEAVVSLGSATKKFGVGTTYVKYVAIDGAGLMDMCSFEVTVIDNEAPQALCKDITVYLDGNGEVTIDSNAVDNGSTDNCEIASFSTDITEFDCDDLGANTVTLTVTDAAGNSFDCWSTVTVLDTITPTIECPADTTLFTSDGPIPVTRAAGDCTFLIEGTTFDPVYDDNCPVTVYLDKHDGAGFQEESTLDGFTLENADTTYTFTWKVVDASGNEASCTFNITLEDDEKPSFNYCPDDVVENTVSTDCNQEAKWHPPFITDLEDNCGVLSISGPYSDDPSLVWDFSDADTTRALFHVGVTEVWYVAEDVNGNKDTCSFTVTIIDNVQPIINSCPTDISLVLNSDCNAPTMEIGDYRGSITYTEQCASTVTQIPAAGTMWVDILGHDPIEGDTVTVTLTVDDGATAPVDCSFKIAFDDKDKPSITCPADMTVYVDGSCEYVLEDFTSLATTSDNCGAVTVTQSPDPLTTTAPYTAGDSFVVTLTADDGNGNTETCTFNVSVEDNLAPKFVDCRDTALALAPGNCTVTFDGNSLTPSVTDNCSGVISVVGVRMDGGALNGSYNAGLTIIEWTATDANGVEATCTSTVDVSIIGLPNCKAGDITVSLNEFGKVEVCGSDLDEGSTSACGAAIVAVSLQRMDGSAPVECDTFTCADVNMVNGVAQPTMVMLVIEDADGNMMMCMGSVTVKDLLPPVIVDCPQDQVLNTDTMVCTAYVSIEPVEIKTGLINGAPISYTNGDNCPVDTLYEITYSAESGWDPVSGSGDPSGAFPKGVNTIVWTIVDVGENTATCTTTITVNDNEAPIVTCPDASTVGGVAIMDADTIVVGTSYDDDYDCDAIVEGLAPTVWDNCNMGNACVPTTLLFSEYAEGSSNNKCVEIFNGTGADVELSDYTLTNYANGSSSGNNIALTPGTLSTGSVWVVCNTNVNPSVFSGANQTSGSLSFNGNDALGLSVGGTTVDAIGQIGTNPGSSWSANGCSTQNAGLARNVFDNCNGSDGSGAFDPSAWASAGCLSIDDFSGFGVAPAPATSTVNPCPITVTYVIEGATTGSGSDDASGTNFLQGVSKLTYTAEDAYGNIGTCETWIKITDDQAPMAVCKDTLDVFLDINGSVSILPADVDNGSTDNCMIDYMTLSDSTFTCDECPGKDVTLTVYDKEQGLSSTCVTYIRINDPIAPSITCVANQDRTTSDDETSADVDAGLTDCDYVAANGEFDPVWSDNCPDDVVISYSLDGGATETVASTLDGYVFGNADTTYTVTWYARDKANTSSCTFTITIEDDEDPIPTCTAPVFATSSDDGKYDCGTYVSITPTTATDNCGVLSINNVSPYADFPGADASGVYPVGTHTVMFFVTDVNNNVSTCSVQVTVTDDQKPTFDPCAADTTLTADAGLCTANLTLTTSAFDNCIINQIDWTATLADGNILTGSTNAVTNGFCTATPNYDFPTGINTVEWIAIDVYGNSDTCTTTVTVTDDEAPEITCPADVVQTADPAACDAAVTGLEATATDNCFVEFMSYTITYPDTTTSSMVAGASIDASGIFPVGISTIEFIAIDSSGNADTCTMTVTISDDEDPMIVCPDDIVMDTDSAKCEAIVVIPVPVTSDNCEVDTFFHNSTYATAGGNDASGTYPEGTTVVDYVVIDIHGNTDTCSFSVTINDNEKPMITCSGGGTRTTSQDSLQFNLPASAYDCGYTVGNAPGTAGEFDPVASSDNCCIASITHDFAGAPSATTLDGAVIPVGETTITWTITDCHGNSEVCSDVITVTDNETPVAKCKPDNCRFNLPTSGVFTLPQATVDQLFRPGNFDNCTANEDLIIEISKTSFDCSNIGENLITLTVTDEAGNSAFCTFIIEILENTPPDCFTQDITVYLDANGLASITTDMIDANSTDNCGIDTMFLDIYDFDCTNVGPNTVTLTVLDQNTFPQANMSTCTATVTVVDTIAPVCTTKDILVVLDSMGVATIDSNAIDDGSTDACGIASIEVDINTFGCADVGNPVTVTQTVTDVNGVVSTCTATVSVIDDIAPECLTMDIVVYLDENGDASIDSNGVDAGSNDVCGIASIELDITDFTCADMASPVTVTQTVTDNNGLTSTCTAMVVVMDTIAPTCETMDITLYLDANGEVSIDSNGVDDGSSDNCEITSITLSQTDFTCADVGTVTVTQTVTDNGGSSAPAGYTLVGSFEGSDYYVSDGTADWPTSNAAAAAAGGHLADINSAAENVYLQGIVTDIAWIGLTDSELYGGSESAGTSNPATDGWIWTSGAPVTYTNWENNEPNNCCAGEDVVHMNWTSIGMWNDFAESGEFISILEIPVANSSTCTAEITILDTIAPTMVCRDITVYLDAAGNASTIVDSLDGGITDACGIATITASQLDFTCDDIGKQLVTVIATDVNGNVDSCLADVTVIDTIAPEAVCTNIVVQLENGSATITPDMLDGGSSDNCTDSGDLLLSASQTFFTCSDVGDVVVILTVTDLSGNVDTCSATVTVEDNEAPVAICQSATVLIDGNGLGILNPADLVGAGTSDICSGLGELTYSSSRVQFDCTEVGDTIMVDLYVTDANGNSDTCSAEVYVVDNVTPSITCKQTLDVVLSSDGSGTVTVNECVTSATDNCGNVNLKFQSGGGTIILDCSDVGSNLFVIVATDDSGNEATCQLSVNVIDNTAPTAICQDVTVALTGASVTVDPSQVDNGSFDECGCMDSTSMTLDQTEFTAPGTYPVVLTVYDCDGNPATCSANVVVTSTALVETELFMFLEGAYDFGSGEMTTMLNDQGHLPMAQPYNVPGYNYAGTETLSSIPTDMTDWVLVRLFDGTANNVLLGEQAAVLLKDGSITDVNGGNLMFPAASDYRVEIHHWTALAVSSPGGLTDSVGILQHDFRHDMSMALTNGTFTNGPMSDLFTGDYGMIAGNSLYIDANTDLNDIGWAFSEFGTFGRTSSDVNLDGVVDLIDIQIIFFNLFKFSHIP